jgi:hypothetical protein
MALFTAFFDRVEPSVATRMRWYMVFSWSGLIDRAEFKAKTWTVS